MQPPHDLDKPTPGPIRGLPSGRSHRRTANTHERADRSAATSPHTPHTPRRAIRRPSSAWPLPRFTRSPRRTCMRPQGQRPAVSGRWSVLPRGTGLLSAARDPVTWGSTKSKKEREQKGAGVTWKILEELDQQNDLGYQKRATNSYLEMARLLDPDLWSSTAFSSAASSKPVLQSRLSKKQGPRRSSRRSLSDVD